MYLNRRSTLRIACNTFSRLRMILVTVLPTKKKQNAMRHLQPILSPLTNVYDLACMNRNHTGLYMGLQIFIRCMDCNVSKATAIQYTYFL